MSKKSNFIQFVIFALFSLSAGIIQIGTFTLMNELIKFSEGDSWYWVCYLTSLILSIIWNFTFNRRFTFKSAANVPIAMLKLFGFYLVFTPVSTILGNLCERNGVNEYIVLVVTMIINFVLEYIFSKFVMYRNQENTLPDKKKDKTEE